MSSGKSRFRPDLADSQWSGPITWQVEAKLPDDVARAALDILGRVAEAWDYRGEHCLEPRGREHRALLALALLPADLAGRRWHDLSGDERRKIVFAARAAVELGKACAWFFGEGHGA